MKHVSDEDLQLYAYHPHADDGVVSIAKELISRRKAEREAKHVGWQHKKYHRDFSHDTPYDLSEWQKVYTHPAPTDRAGKAVHYPDCWDVAAYPTLESALAEVYGHFKCTNDQCGKQNTVGEDELCRFRGERPAISEEYEAGYAAGLADCQAGYVKVPVEPPTGMESAGKCAVIQTRKVTSSESAIADSVWRAMIAARPKP